MKKKKEIIPDKEAEKDFQVLTPSQRLDLANSLKKQS